MLRLSVEPGGCSGFQYRFELEEHDNLETEDAVFEKAGARVVVDDASLALLSGATIDFEDEVCLLSPPAVVRLCARDGLGRTSPTSCMRLWQMMKSSFVVADNPQSSASCGCGTSFQAKDV